MQQRAPALCQRVMFLTGDSSAADHQACLAQCGRPWLATPCAIAALRQALQQVRERLLQLSRTSQALRQRSHALVGKVQTLSAWSRHVRCQTARLWQPGRTVDHPWAS